VTALSFAPLHFHQLKWIAQSPAHFSHYIRNPLAKSKAMRLGSAVDRLVEYGGATLPEAFKESTALAGLKNKGEATLALGMFDALKAHSDAWSLLSEGEQQRGVLWELAGRKCEGTPDVFTPTRLVDLKTTRSGHPARFQRDGRWRGYHAQLSWYRDGLKLAGLADPRECFLVTVENVAPHIVTVFEVTERALEQGEKLWRSWFERLRICEDANDWPGYSLGRAQFDVPDDGETVLKIDGEDVEVE
jgi:exodeoxyribonuclease VIII